MGSTLQSEIKWGPYESPFFSSMILASHLSTVLILYSVVYGNEAVMTTLAVLGTTSVVLLGARALKKSNQYTVTLEGVEESRVEKPSLFLVEESQEVLRPPHPSV